jgi:hypothetical protein
MFRRAGVRAFRPAGAPVFRVVGDSAVFDFVGPNA